MKDLDLVRESVAYAVGLRLCLKLLSDEQKVKFKDDISKLTAQDLKSYKEGFDSNKDLELIIEKLQKIVKDN